VRKQGNQNHYQANTVSPIYNELLGIVKKTFGVSGVLKASLAPLLPHCEQVFIYGSMAKGEEHASSDIDVMLVGEGLNYSEIMTLLESAEAHLQRPINPTLYSVVEFEQRLADGNAFLTKVMAQSRIDLLSKSE
jgi:predicted nucleotidyltransferase